MAERKLGEAAEIAEKLSHAPGRSPWLYWMTPHYFECSRGVTFGMLAAESRYRRRAVRELEAGFSHLPEEQQGSAWTGRFLAHLAAAHARGGDQAASVALRCASIARATESRRLAAMVLCVHDRLLDQWPAHPGVAALTEAIH